MISFDPTEEQRMITDTVHKFALEQMREVARESDENGHIPDEVIQIGWELGLVPAHIPEAYGGFGEPSSVTGALVAEELAWGDLAMAMQILCPALVALPILLCGTEEQKARYLPRFCEERYRPATAALIEPRIQFDPNALTTIAQADGDAYVLNGRKCYVPLAADAELILVYATLDRVTEGFLVERGAPGLAIGQREKNMGLKALPTYELTLQNCRVPRENRLGGEVGCDFTRLLNGSRVALAAMAVGVARAAYEYAREYAKERVQFGEPIAHRQAIAFMLAEMAIEIDATRLMAWEAAWKLDRGEDATREAYLAKLYADDMVLKVTDGAVQVLGGHGYIREHPVELWLRNGRGFVTFDGMAMV